MNNIEVFKHTEFGEIRTIMQDNEPWFIAKDVCDILAIGNSRQALSYLDEDEQNSVIINDGKRGNPSRAIINESGLYSLMLRSRKPDAKKFKKWITSEVLPSIRKHGAYMTPQKIEEVLLNPDTIIKLALQLKELQKENTILRTKIEEDKEKVTFVDTLTKSETDMTIEHFAKLLSGKGIIIGRNKLFKILRDNYVLKADNTPYQVYINNGYFSLKLGTFLDYVTGNVKEYTQTRITGKGQVKLANKIKEWVA